MALKVTLDSTASLKEQLAIAANVNNDILKAQKIAGEKFVTDCREQVQSHELGTYLDDTTNLRNSVGYFIRIDRMLEHTDLNSTGIAREAAMAALEDVPKRAGIQLIGLVGMNYASHVESMGYNVMSLQADVALVDLGDLYKAVEKKYK